MVEPISSFVAQQVVEYAISKGLDHVFRKEPESFKTKLAKVIRITIDEFDADCPIAEESQKFPFYKSQIFVEELLKFRFFHSSNYSFSEEKIKIELKANPNILEPNNEQLNKFYELFDENLEEDTELKSLAIDEGFKVEVFNISQKVSLLFDQINRVERNTENIIRKLDERVNLTNETPKELTALQQRPSSAIIGREDDLKNLRKILLNKNETLLMNGMGGVGKTTLAEVYVKSYLDTYNHIVWINVEDNFKEAVLSNYLLLRNLRLESIPTEEKIATCFNKLSELSGPNLLVIDNANLNLAEYYNQLPKAPNWHVLITSRERIEGFEILDIDFLSIEDGSKLFEKYCTLFTIDKIKQIVERVERHTLTIEVLAKAAERNKWSFEQCINALGVDAKVNVPVGHENNKNIERIKTYLTKIFSASKLDEQQKWILKQFIALPSIEIEYEFLYNLLQIEKLKWKDDFPAALEGLYETGFLQKNIELESYKLHVVLNEVLTAELLPGVEDIEDLIETVTGMLSIDQTKDNPIHRFPFIPYGDTIVELFSKSDNSELAILKNNLALVYQDLGEYKKALDLLEAALNSNLENFGENHPTVAVSQSNLAIVYQDLGEYKKARDLLEAALNSDLENFGENHPTVAIRQSNLAIVYQDLGEYKKARDLLEAALNSNLENFGENHPTVAVSQSNLALVYKALGEYKKARDLLEAALNSDLENFGENHPTVAVSQSNLGSVYQDLGEYKKANHLWQSAYKIFEEALGKDHPNTKTVLSFLEQLKKGTNS